MDDAVFQNEIVPFYFGISPKMLYGCHHMPQGMRTKACGVVLCSPIGQEYIQSHRAAYQLAVRLSQAGFHVLRFDYFGCGDSGGDFEEGSLLQWTSDIHTAIEEMQERSGLTSVCLIGLRIGATLALKAANDCHHVDSIILWEPIFDGKHYLEELAKAQQEFSSQMSGRNKWALSRSEIANEVVGFPFTSNLKEDLARINMDSLKLRSDVKVLTLYNSEESKRVNGNHFTQNHPHADSQLIVDHKVWANELYKRLIPFKTLGHLVNWVDTVHS
jgi:uncharacterized protein